MNVVKKKLNSEKGASITWALLIFMVCAVVGSIVLVAGTTASGRMSKLADSEQRYYAVTSAAGLLRDVLKEPITVTRTATYDSDGNPSSYSISYGSSPDIIVNTLVKKLMHWPDAKTESVTDPTSSPPSFWIQDSYHAEELPVEISFASAPNVCSAVEGLNVDAIKLGSDGSIITAVSKDGFSLQLVFDLKRTVVDPEASGNTITKSDTFQWVLKEARKIEAKAS